MKKLSKILVLALSLAVVLSAFVFASAAEDAPFLVEGLHRENWAEAIDNADENMPVELLNNYQVQDGETVEISQSVKINLNGYTLKGSSDGEPLFTIAEEGVKLIIAGPGKIEVNGTLLTVDASGAGVSLDGTSGALEIVSASEDSVFVVGGEAKAFADVKGEINFKNKVGANLFELASASKLNVYESNVKITVDGATEASGFALLGAGTVANVNPGAVISNTAGHIFKVQDTDVSTPATVNVEAAVLTSNSATYGSILDADGEYASFTARISEINAGGYAFIASDNVKEDELPAVSVAITSCSYTVTNISKSDASLFWGNLTGVVSASKLIINSSNTVAVGSRLWDGSCGVLLKEGVKCNVLIASALSAPIEGSDGSLMYYDPESSANQNFSLDTINGKQCTVYKAQTINENSEVESFYIVGINTGSYEIDTSYSTNFQNVELVTINSKNDNKTASNVYTQAYFNESHSSTKIEEDASGNRYLKLEYLQGSKDYYFDKDGIARDGYFSLKLGYGGQKQVPTSRLQYNQEFITFDFDITSDAVDADGNAVYYEGNFYLMQRLEGGGYSWHDNPHLKITTTGLLTCGNTNLQEKGADYTVQLSREPGVWTHITIVLDIRNGSTYEYQKESMMHFYVDGVYEGSRRIFNDNAWDLTEDKIKLLTSDEFRMVTPKLYNGDTGVFTTDKAGNSVYTSRSIIFDNIVQTFYPDGYAGDLLKIREDKSFNLKDLGDTVYSTGYKYPDGITKDQLVANVDGTDYYIMENALSAISSGSVVELYADVEAPYTANVPFTVNTNGHKFEIKSTTHYVYPLTDENGNAVYQLYAASNFLPIYWDLGVSYETKVPLGVAPEYTGAIPEPTFGRGTQTTLVGWSYTEGAKVPDELRPVTKEDIDRGYIILYPVFDITSVLVDFKDRDGNVFASEWVSLVDENNKYIDITEASLAKYQDGSNFDVIPVNSWYNASFSGWDFENYEGETLGKEPLAVTPLFDSYRSIAVRQSYAIVNLSQFVPKMFVAYPEDGVEGVKILGVTFKPENDKSKYVSKKDVTFGGETLCEFSLGEDPQSFAAIPSSVIVYFHFEVNGTVFTQEVELRFDSYLEKLFDSSMTDAEKTAVMNMFRMVDSYTKLTGAASSPVVEKYLSDPAYTAYLTDLADVQGIAESQIYRNWKDNGREITYKEFNEMQWNGDGNKILGLGDGVKYINWDFVSNSITIQMDLEKHPLIARGHDVNSYPGLFVLGGVLIDGHQIRCTNNSSQASVGIVKLTFAHNSDYDKANVFAFNAFTDAYIRMDGFEQPNGSWDRTSIFSAQYGGRVNDRAWNITAQITHLAERMAAGEEGLEAQFDMARIVYIAHQSMGDALNQKDQTHMPFRAN